MIHILTQSHTCFCCRRSGSKFYLSMVVCLLLVWLPVTAGAAMPRISQPQLLLKAALIAVSDVAVNNDRTLVFPAQQVGFIGSVQPSAGNTASFTATGEAGDSGTARVVNRRINLTAPGTTRRIRVTDFSYSGNLNPDGSFHFPTGSGEVSLSNLLVSGTATVRNNTPAGDYSGSGNFQIRVGRSRVRVPFTVNMVILGATQVENQRPMVFPAQLTNFSGSYLLQPSMSGSAEFSATGDAGESATASVSPATVHLTRAGEAKKIDVSDFRFGGYSGINPLTGNFHFPAGSGQTVARGILVGATAVYPSGLSAGTYSATATLTIVYH